MNIKLEYPYKWSYQKEVSIISLILERVNLLIGENCTSKIFNLVFASKLPNHDSLSTLFYMKDAIIKKNLENDIEFFINGEVLNGMLSPGVGQSYFDEIVVSAKGIIQKS